MNVIGALAKSNSQSVIYFCKFEKTECEIEGIRNLVAVTGYTEKIYVNSIQAVAIDSCDEMKNELNFIGIIFKNDDKYITLTANGFEDVEVYLREIAE